jgi:hypothetical protein
MLLLKVKPKELDGFELNRNNVLCRTTNACIRLEGPMNVITCKGKIETNLFDCAITDI